MDIFEQTILCKDCNKKMQPIIVAKDNFQLRAIQCPKCNHKIIHPADKREFQDFQNMKQKHYKVKLRFVGNSYAVSIPKEIINFMNEQEKQMKQMVDLSFEDFRRLSLNF